MADRELFTTSALSRAFEVPKATLSGYLAAGMLAVDGIQVPAGRRGEERQWDRWQALGLWLMLYLMRVAKLPPQMSAILAGQAVMDAEATLLDGGTELTLNDPATGESSVIKIAGSQLGTGYIVLDSALQPNIARYEVGPPLNRHELGEDTWRSFIGWDWMTVLEEVKARLLGESDRLSKRGDELRELRRTNVAEARLKRAAKGQQP